MPGQPTRQTWLTLGAASEQLGVSESTIRRWADAGEIRSYRTNGGHRRILEEDLLAIVANEARNRRRAEGRRNTLALRQAGERTIVDTTPSPERVALASEASTELLSALERLGDDDRLVLSCRFLLDLGEEETARALGVRRGTVKSRTSRALDRLRRELEESHV